MASDPKAHVCRLKPAASAMLVLCGVATAQTAPDDKPAGLQSIVISGTKRIEKLDNVPASISVLNSEALERNNVKDMVDIGNLTPSLTIVNAPSIVANNSINMRGVGTSSFTIGVSADVAILIDDIPIGMQMRAFQDLADVLRVEVLKGPQSTLFGRSAIAGAVSIVTRPIGSTLGGNVSLGLTSDGEKRAKVSVSGPLSETLGFRVALGYNDFDGNMRNLTLGTKTNGSNSKTAVLKLQWQPINQFSLDFSPRYNRTDSNCCVFPLREIDPSAVYFANVPAAQVRNFPISEVLAGIGVGPKNLDVRHDRATYQTQETKGAGLRASWYFNNGMTLASITGYETLYSEDTNDGDFSTVPVFSFLTRPNGTPNPDAKGQFYTGWFDVKSVSQELRLLSPDDSALRYVVGLWYAKNHIERFLSRGYGDLAGSNPREYLTWVFNRNTALFGNASWDLTPRDTLGLGLRLNREVSGFSYKAGLPPPYPNGVFTPTVDVTGVNGRFGTPTATDDVVTGKLSAQHRFSPQLMGYASYSTGYKGYAYDLLSSTDNLRTSIQPIDPETAKSHEVGIKGNFLNNTLTVNATLFHTKFKNFQSTSSTSVTDPITGIIGFLPYLNSLGVVKTQGLELDVAWLANRQLLLNAAFAYIDASIVSYPYGDCYAVPGSPNGGFNDNCIVRNPARGNANTSDKAGNPLPQSPKLKLSLGGQYDLALPALGLDAFVNGNVRAQARTYTNLMNPTLTLPGYSITNVGFGVRSLDGKYKLSFNVNNLFDKQYSYFDGVQPGTYVKADGVTRVRSVTWMPPRDALRYYGVRFDANF